MTLGTPRRRSLLLREGTGIANQRAVVLGNFSRRPSGQDVRVERRVLFQGVIPEPLQKLPKFPMPRQLRPFLPKIERRVRMLMR